MLYVYLKFAVSMFAQGGISSFDRLASRTCKSGGNRLQSFKKLLSGRIAEFGSVF